MGKERLIEVMKDTRANAAWHRWSYEESADYLIANGVTIPVRCKECKHMVRNSNVYPQDIGCLLFRTDYCIEPEHFCSYGERRN